MKANNQKAPITFTPEEIHQLAVDIDKLTQDFDQYGYWAQLADDDMDEAKYVESAVIATEEAIISGDTGDIEDFLKDAIVEFREIPDLADDLSRAKELLCRLNNAADFLNSKKEAIK